MPLVEFTVLGAALGRDSLLTSGVVPSTRAFHLRFRYQVLVVARAVETLALCAVQPMLAMPPALPAWTSALGGLVFCSTTPPTRQTYGLPATALPYALFLRVL
jgi:hypothetical protein